MTKRLRGWCLVVSALVLAIAASTAHGPAVAAGDNITGVVTSAAGPEAGVWVIAETSDFDASFRKIVVTDDAGRFLVPDLPTAGYHVWVRGYGLVDSEKHAAEPGDDVGLRVTAAATPREAAQIYPANYWYSLLEVPPARDFPGTGPRGNGIGTAMKTQADWIDRMKDGCQLCHQLGNRATREMPMLDLETFDSTADAWNYRLQAGGAGPAMAAEINRIGRPRAVKLYSEWSDRIRAGELPPVPPRPTGVERNVVLSMWGWGTRKAWCTTTSRPTSATPRCLPVDRSTVWAAPGSSSPTSRPIARCGWICRPASSGRAGPARIKGRRRRCRRSTTATSRPGSSAAAPTTR